MKAFTAVLALSSISSVFAAPTPKPQLDILGGLLTEVEGIATGVVGLVEQVLPIETILGPLGIDAITGLVKSDLSTGDVLQTVTNLLSSTQGHKLAIQNLLGNSTGLPTAAVLGLVNKELTTVYSEIAAVTKGLSPVTGLVFGAADVTTIAKTLVGVIGGVVQPVYQITGAAGLNTILTPVLGELTGVVGQVVMVSEGVASGVLSEVTGLLNIPAVGPVVDTVLGGLIPHLLSGDLTGLTGLLSL